MEAYKQAVKNDRVILPKIEEIFERTLSKDEKQWNRSRKKFLFSYLCSVVESRNVEFDSAAVRLFPVLSFQTKHD